MGIFALTYVYTDNADGRDEHRSAHKDHITSLAEKDIVLISGPLGPHETPGALIVVRADDKASALAHTDTDPFRVHGLVASVTATEWVPMLGRLTQEI